MPGPALLSARSDLDDNGPEGAASDGRGKMFVNLEGKAEIQVVDSRTMKSVAIWPITPCEGPTGIAIDRTTNRIFSGCGKTSVVVDASTGKVVAQIANGDGVDALGWDQSEKLIYIPANGGRGAANGTVTIVHEDSPDKYTVVGTVNDLAGRQDHCGRSREAPGVPVPARVWPGAGAGTWLTAADRKGRSARPDRRSVVLRRKPLSKGTR